MAKKETMSLIYEIKKGFIVLSIKPFLKIYGLKITYDELANLK